MARARRIERAGGIYHVIARGNERKPVFHDETDREIYLRRLVDCRFRYQFRILAYCLMQNHIHLALQRGPIALSRVMPAIQSFYAQKFNLRHKRVGHLFQGRYKAFLVQEERYLFALLRYIHLNPVAAAIVERPESYRWSSDRFYRRGAGPAWLDIDAVLPMLAAQRRTAVSVYRQLMTNRNDDYEDAATYGSAVKGERAFAELALESISDPPKLPSGWTPEGLAGFVARDQGFSLERLRQPGSSLGASRARLIAAYLGRQCAGFSVARMARCFGREESTFNRGVHRLEGLISRDASVRAYVAELSSRIAAQNTGIHD